MRGFLGSLLLVCTGLNAQPAQTLDFRHYEVEEGLSNNIVICSLQDHQGFMWFGTSDGLNRFDGNTFKVFRHDPENPHSIGSNAITYLFQDRDGRLWIGTSKGLYYYDASSERFITLPFFTGKYIRAIQDDSLGRLWFVAEGDVYHFSLAALLPGKPIHLALAGQGDTAVPSSTSAAGMIRKVDLKGRRVTAISEQRSGTIWLGTQTGEIIDYQVPSGQLTFRSSGLMRGNSIEKILETGNGQLLIGTSAKGMLRLDTRTGRFTGPLLKGDQGGSEIFVRDIVKYQPDEYWVATEDGLYRYRTDVPAGQWVQKHIKKIYGDPFSLSDNALYTLCKDREGGIWVGTYFGGLNYLANRPINFEKYFPGTVHPKFVGNAIREITQDKYGNFWIGTEDAGLNKANFKTGKFQHIETGPKGQAAHTNIHGMLADGSRLYVGTFEHGLDVMDIPSGAFIHHYRATDKAEGLHSNFINAIIKTRGNRIIICTARGLYYFYPSSGTFQLINALPEDEFYSAITEDQAGRIWVGTHTRGVYYLENGAWRRLAISFEGKDFLQSTRILYIKEDASRRLWIATEDGLCRVTDLKQVKMFGIHRGLPSNIVYCLVPDSLNNMWLTTSRGMAKINSQTDKVVVYNKADGLLNNQFNYQSGFQDAQGYIYFGSVKGLIRFNPYHYIESDYRPPLFFTGLQIFDQDVVVDSSNSPLHQSLEQTRNLTLSYKESTFSFDFAALSYSAPANLQFAYKMEGLDQDWTYLQSNRRIYFTNLAAGTYSLKIKSTNSSGLWVHNERDLKIHILPPFWKSDGAYLCYILALAFLIVSAVYYNNHKHKMRTQRRMALYKLTKEKELYQSKVDFFTHIAHEIRTPLTLIKGPMDKILEEKQQLPHLEGYIDLMQRNTNRLLDLTHELLDFRKIESDSMDLALQPIEMNGWLQHFIAPYQMAAEAKGIQFLFVAYRQSITANIDLGAMTKIVTNLLDNALKYADAVIMVGLCLTKDNQHFTIQIDNDGYLVPTEFHQKIFDPFFRWNRKKQVKGSGIGLFISNSLAALHGGTLQFRTTDDHYNTFLLTIKLDGVVSGSGNLA